MYYHPRFLKCQEYMKEENLAATIAVSPENTLYFTECYLMTQTDLRERLAMAVMPVDSDPVMIAAKVESDSVEAETWIQDKRYYVEFETSPMKMMADVLKEKHLENGRIGLEINYLMASYYLELIQLLPNATFVPCHRIFDQVRAIKEMREIKQLSYAALNTVRSLEAAVKMTQVGDSENDFAVRIIKSMLDGGCEEMSFMCMGSGKRSEMPHIVPSPHVKLEHGSVIHIDFGGKYNRYNSDIARDILVGKKNDKHVDVYKRLTDAYVAGIEQLKPGLRACDVYQFAKEQYAKNNIPFAMSLVGHGLGIGLHELPMLVPSETKELEEDMILCYEIATVVDGYNYHVEDLIHITKNGYEVLSQPELDVTMPWIAPNIFD